MISREKQVEWVVKWKDECACCGAVDIPVDQRNIGETIIDLVGAPEHAGPAKRYYMYCTECKEKGVRL